MKLSPFQQMALVGIGGIAVIVISGYILFFDNYSSNKSSEKCYGLGCKTPYLPNEIVGADFSHKYVVILLRSGTELTTTCLTSQWNFSENATAWWCGMEIHTIQYVSNQ